jgi:hypothetical protein
MDMVVPTPSATAFEAIAAMVSAALYLIVGMGALARAPKDVRTRVFLAIALASAAPYSVTALIWARGSTAAFTRPVAVVVGLSLMLGSLALFHFTQVFPWRRPWIRGHGRWLYRGYAAAAVITGATGWMLKDAFGDLAASGSSGLGATAVAMGDVALAMVLLLVVVPGVFVLGVAVPFAALWSLYRTWLAAKSAGVESARVTTYWILLSQMAGGVLTILIIPLLRFIAPTGPWVTIAAALLFAFGLLMPIAFAAGVWKYRVLELDPESAPAVR